MALAVPWALNGSPECRLEQEVWINVDILKDGISVAGVEVPDIGKLREVFLE